jgi:hypothetical protein
MLLIKNTIYFGLLSYLYLMNINSNMAYLIYFKIFISNYNYVKNRILNNDYLNQIRAVIFLIKYMDIFYKMYVTLLLNCFNFILKYIKKIILKEVMPTKEFRTNDDINNFLNTL